ncbi:MAG: hypothetical protein ABGX16_12065 [Pirellulales bacterium]
MNSTFYYPIAKSVTMGLLLLASVSSSIWAASFQGLGVLPIESSLLQSGATAVSFDGTAIVGTVETDSTSVAFLWTESSGTMTQVGVIDQNNPTSWATAVSTNAQFVVEFVVGHAGSDAGTQAFYRTSVPSVVGLDDLAGGQFDSRATGISADGQVIVGTGHSNFGSEAFRFDNPGRFAGRPGNASQRYLQ